MVNGDLPPTRPDQSYDPPEGGQAIAGQKAVIKANKVIIIGSSGGLFMYNGFPLKGSLIASITSPAVTNDGHGNATLPGITAYLPGVNVFAVQILGEQINFATAASESGPWTTQGSIFDGLWNEPSGSQINLSIAGGNQLLVEQAQIVASVLTALNAAATIAGGLTVTGGASVTGGETADQITINGTGTAQALTISGAGNHTSIAATGASNAHVASLINTLASPNNPLVLIEGAAAGDPMLRLDVNADTNARLAIDNTGLHRWGTGAATPDTRLYRGGVGQLAADSIAANATGNVPETWHTPTFANGWTSPANPVLQYRQVASPYNEIQWTGRLLVPAGVVGNQAITAAIPAAYRPTDVQDIMALDITAAPVVPVWLAMAAGSGVLSYVSGSVAGHTLTIPSGNGLISLDA